MNVTETLPSKCGDDLQLPTPTPEPTPTPPPADCSCSPSNFTKIELTGPDFAGSGGHSFDGFSEGAFVSYDENTLSNAVSSSVSLNYPNSSFAGLITFGGKKPNNTTFYVKYGNTCYSATATSSNGSSNVWDLTMSVSKTLSSNCGDDNPFVTSMR